MPSLNPFQVLQRHRNFRLFLAGQTLSLIGTWMQSMAQGWLALELSNNAFLVGVVVAAGSLPVMLFSLHGGVLADRYERLRLVKLCQVLFLTEATALFVMTWTGHITVGWLIFFAIVQGSISAVEIPARQALIVGLVNRDDTPQAIALNASGFNLARVVGPAIGAVVIANLGIAWAFGFNAMSYVAVLAGLFMIRLDPWRPAEQLVRPWEGIRESLRFMRDTPLVAAVMKLITVYSILGVPYIALMPVFARERLALGASGYGVLLACVGIGGLAGALGLATQASTQAGGRSLAAASFAYPALLLVLCVVRDPRLAYPLLLVTGATMIINGATSNTVLQHSVPDVLRGRIMAAYSFVVVGLAQTVGAFLAGIVARALGVQWAIALGALIMLAYASHAFRQPALRALRSPGGGRTVE